MFGLHAIQHGGGGGGASLTVPDIAMHQRLPAMQKQTKALRVV